MIVVELFQKQPELRVYTQFIQWCYSSACYSLTVDIDKLFTCTAECALV